MAPLSNRHVGAVWLPLPLPMHVHINVLAVDQNALDREFQCNGVIGAEIRLRIDKELIELIGGQQEIADSRKILLDIRLAKRLHRIINPREAQMIFRIYRSFAPASCDQNTEEAETEKVIAG